jgi:hypothetical protein
MGARSLNANSAAAAENSCVSTREAALFKPYINHLRVLSVGQAAELTGEPAEELAGEFAAEQRNSSGIRAHNYRPTGSWRAEAHFSVWLTFGSPLAYPIIFKRLLRVCESGRIPATLASLVTLNATTHSACDGRELLRCADR